MATKKPKSPDPAQEPQQGQPSWVGTRFDEEREQIRNHDRRMLAVVRPSLEQLSKLAGDLYARIEATSNHVAVFRLEVAHEGAEWASLPDETLPLLDIRGPNGKIVSLRLVGDIVKETKQLPLSPAAAEVTEP